ncbi:MAG TPA: hypothetical protein VMU81_14115 [Acetobacteraceae bacterium]|jgi:hypothetical protein|nr:hypothetical protein [Acetobacteraceae bacterium]
MQRSNAEVAEMPAAPSPETLTAELEILLARNGIKVPDMRRDAVMAAYADLRQQIALLHGRYGAAAEPSNVFRLSPTESQGGAT